MTSRLSRLQFGFKLLALIIMSHTLGQWGAPWLAGKMFDARHSYSPAWKIMTAAGVLGTAANYAIRLPASKMWT